MSYFVIGSIAPTAKALILEFAEDQMVYQDGHYYTFETEDGQRINYPHREVFLSRIDALREAFCLVSRDIKSRERLLAAQQQNLDSILTDLLALDRDLPEPPKEK